MTTADGEISYTPFTEKVQLVHQKNCELNNWNFKPLSPGSYGYDNLVYCLAACQGLSNLEEMASLIHDAWTVNYIYWRDNSPWEKNSFYRKPFSPLNDERRNMCASLAFSLLPEDEKKKDEILAKIILELNGDQNLSD